MKKQKNCKFGNEKPVESRKTIHKSFKHDAKMDSSKERRKRLKID